MIIEEKSIRDACIASIIAKTGITFTVGGPSLPSRAHLEATLMALIEIIARNQFLILELQREVEYVRKGKG